MNSNPSGSPPRPVTGPNVAAIMASRRDYVQQQQWKRYNIATLTIDVKSLAIKCPLDNGRLNLDALPYRSSPIDSALLLLPPELLHHILRHLSIRAITDFRLLSTHARSIVSSSPHYAALFTHAPASLRSILATGTGAHVTLQQLHTALTTPECSFCGIFGNFFNLLTSTRMCHACFATSPRHPYRANAQETHLLPAEVTLVKSIYGLSAASLAILPTVRSIPGMYGRERSNFKRQRIQLCLPSAARELGIKQHGSVKSMNESVEKKRREFEEKERSKWKGTDWPSGGIIIGSSTPDFRDWDMGWDNPFRHMVVVRFPWLRRDGEVERGVSCGRCREKSVDGYQGERWWHVRYSKEGLEKHLNACLEE